MTSLWYGKKLNSSIGIVSTRLMYSYHPRWSARRALLKSGYNSHCEPIERLLSLTLSARHFSSAPKKSYYDVLKITPKATQAQVKNAYYDLSKKYHPDQYKGKEDATLKFREVREAYDILGNLQKRRMYDKGILNFGVAASPAEAEEYSSKFYESRRNRSKMPSSGRTPIYDFDEWSKTHYEETFAYTKKRKERYEEMKRKEELIRNDKKTNSVMIVMIVGCCALIIQMVHSNEDHPKKPGEK